MVAYGAPELVRRALAPLIGKYPLTVVDNSGLGEIAEITRLAGGVYHDPGRNGGFAAGVNYALSHRQFPDADVLLLNPDAVVGPEDIELLHRELHRQYKIASVGPVQTDEAGTPARVGWPFPSPVGTWVEAIGLGRLRRAEDFVIGSVLLLNSSALAEVGGFDERFFLYAEETDWARRAARLGWRHLVVQEAQAIHLGGATSPDPVRRETHFHASQERYHRKHFGGLGWLVTRAGVALGAAVRSVAASKVQRAVARRRLLLYLRGPAAVEGRLDSGNWTAG
jgi:GT2 family glycosyltransferase